MLQRTSSRLAASPGIQIAPETTPVKVTPQMLGWYQAQWWGTRRAPYRATFIERPWRETWPVKPEGWSKGKSPVLQRAYSREALHAITATIPAWFEVRDVPRPPARIKAQSEGIVGRWYTNYWTLHSIKHQCMLAKVPWAHGERQRPITNFEQPANYVDFEESKAVRDYRTRWINVNRSMVGMCKRMKEVEEENRFLDHKRTQDQFWSNRRVLISRVKAMTGSGAVTSAEDIPIKTMNLRAFD
jgi:hypothetical protein